MEPQRKLASSLVLAAGNVTNDGSHSYTYDAENRIIKVDTGTTAVYVYDAAGNRIRKTTGSVSVDYLYDLSGRVITEVSSSGGWNRGEVFAGGHHIATYSGGTSGTISFTHADWLGTERKRTDKNGASIETCTNLPFGDGQGCTGTDVSPLHFTGKQRDTESNNDDFGARYFNSGMARWLTPDWSARPEGVPYATLANPQTLNLYAYVGNNPVTHTDPDGHLVSDHAETFGEHCEVFADNSNLDPESEAYHGTETQQQLSVSIHSEPSSSPLAISSIPELQWGAYSKMTINVEGDPGKVSASASLVDAKGNAVDSGTVLLRTEAVQPRAVSAGIAGEKPASTGGTGAAVQLGLWPVANKESKTGDPRGPVELRLTVTDSKGHSASAQTPVRIGGERTATGDKPPKIFNFAPKTSFTIPAPPQ